MYYVALPVVISLLLLPAASGSPSQHNLIRRSHPHYTHANANSLQSYSIASDPYKNHIRVMLYASTDDLLQRRAALAYAMPGSRGSSSQEVKNKQAVGRVNSAQRKDKDSAVGDINSAHTKANNLIDYSNGGERNADNKLKQAQGNAKAHPNDRKAQQELLNAQKLKITATENGEFLKTNAQINEQKSDVKAIEGFNTKSTDMQNLNFNKDGNAKSDAQKAKEKAKAGFMKFLEVFGEVLSMLTIAFPGPGEILGVVIKLGETVGKAAEDIAKVAKVAGKIDKFGNDVRKVLDIKPGTQVIQGVSGKEMADLQKQLIDELIGLAAKNTAATGKKVQDTARPAPKVNLPICRTSRIQGCRPKVRRSFLHV